MSSWSDNGSWPDNSSLPDNGSFDPAQLDEQSLEPAERFAALACLRYDRSDAPPRRRAAAEMLRRQPDVVDRSMAAAVAAFDPEAVGRHVSRDPSAATRQCGPFGWEPILYLAFSRFPGDRTVEEILGTARLLLDAGAHPEAGYLWSGLTPPFTALTGSFGGGEMGPGRQPEHSAHPALARLLLQRGADPNDAQALYNRMFVPGTEYLELLFEFGLGSEVSGRGWWRRSLGTATESIARMLDRQVRWAADHGYTDRLELFSGHGIDVGAAVVAPDAAGEPRDVNAKVDGQTALHTAVWNGDLAAVRELLAAGADPMIVDDRFGGTAAEWARFCYQEEIAEVLPPIPGDEVPPTDVD